MGQPAYAGRNATSLAGSPFETCPFIGPQPDTGMILTGSMAKSQKNLPPRLVASAFGYLLGGAILFGIALMLVMPRYSQAITDRTLDRSVMTRTESLALDFARKLYADWEDIAHLASVSADLPVDELRARLDGLVGTGSRVSWVGFAGLDGTVIASSGSLLEGVDVSARPWFAAGLRGGFAGDVHDAVLLSRLLGGTDTHPLRFIDFALPVLNDAGDLIGVLASHTTFDWVEQYLQESAIARSIDVYLVNAAGQVAFATDDTPVDLASVQSLRAAATGIAAQTRETWPDGQEYFSTTIPTVTYADLPSFGWRLVGRVPGDETLADQREFEGILIAIVIGAALLFFAYIAIFVLIFLRPLTQLVDSAEKIAGGQQVYPRESRSSAEAIRLSWALARIESRLFKYYGDDDAQTPRKPPSVPH